MNSYMNLMGNYSCAAIVQDGSIGPGTSQRVHHQWCSQCAGLPPTLPLLPSRSLSIKQLRSRWDRTQPCLIPDFTSKLGDTLPSTLTWHQVLMYSPWTRSASPWGTPYFFKIAMRACRFTESHAFVRSTKDIQTGVWYFLALPTPAGLPKSDPQCHVLSESHTGLPSAGAQWWSAAFPGESRLAPCRAHWAVPLCGNCHRPTCLSFMEWHKCCIFPLLRYLSCPPYLL